ncbi:CDP-diacylglycerol diphosphatase [Methylocella sp.]|jgi:CDP-diacylglycerol pyrophosphatase|uniref:CDP-diacylglycerol diphosphatase n=1 Tax=Methylocella sp. TaxID=1978226 RepID=UPI003C286ADF
MPIKPPAENLADQGGAPAKRRRWRLPAFAAFAALAGVVSLAALGVGAAVDENALWKIVHGLCVVDEMHLHSPAPCVAVDLKSGEEDGSAVLKDLVGKTQFLLIPTRRLAGIEDPLIGTGALPNYWRAAWAARGLVSKNAQKELPRDDIGMAINGAGARTQDQLHIHVDCVRVDVRAALEARAGEIGDKWADFALLGHTYRARRVSSEEPDPDPFRLLAEDSRSSPLRDDSLAVIGARFASGAPGFVLLAEKAPHGATHAENLLDHSCAVALQ